MSQSIMIGMQQLLMAVSTFAALQVLQHVRALLATASLLLNLLRRGHDVSNTTCVVLLAWYLESQVFDDSDSVISRAIHCKIGAILTFAS